MRWTSKYGLLKPLQRGPQIFGSPIALDGRLVRRLREVTGAILELMGRFQRPSTGIPVLGFPYWRPHIRAKWPNLEKKQKAPKKPCRGGSSLMKGRIVIQLPGAANRVHVESDSSSQSGRW